MCCTYAERLQQVLSLLVDIKLTALAVLSEVQSGNLWNVLILALTLLFLELEGDTANWSTLDTLHQVGGVAGNLYKSVCRSLWGMGILHAHLVAQTLGGDHGNFIADTLVGLEVESQLWVVSLDDDLGGLLHGLGADTTHFDGIVRCWWLTSWIVVWRAEARSEDVAENEISMCKPRPEADEPPSEKDPLFYLDSHFVLTSLAPSVPHRHQVSASRKFPASRTSQAPLTDYPASQERPACRRICGLSGSSSLRAAVPLRALGEELRSVDSSSTNMGMSDFTCTLRSCGVRALVRQL